MKNQYWPQHWPVAVRDGPREAHIVDFVDIRVVDSQVVYTLCELVKRLEEIKAFSDRLDGDQKQLRDAVGWALLHVGSLAWWIGNWGEVCPTADGTVTPWREQLGSLFDYYQGKALE